MANSAGISYEAKKAALAAIVDGKAMKAALYLTSATTGPSNTAYTATGELAATGNYTAGGATVTNANSASNGANGATAYWTPSASISWSNLTSSGNFDCVMIYSTTDTNRNIGTFTFTSQSITAGTLTLTMPTNDGTTGLVRIA